MKQRYFETSGNVLFKLN